MHGKRRIFGRIRKTIILLFSLYCSQTYLNGQEEESLGLVTSNIEALDSIESWLLFEKGIYSYNTRNYGESLNFFNKLIERHGVYPEAEYWIGRIFEQEGEYLLAEKQYKKALEAERTLLIPMEKYDIRYRLAELYKNREDFDNYKQILNSIVLDELEENLLALNNEKAVINSLKSRGIDRTLLLFRHEFTYSIESFTQLGIFYYKMGDYRASTSKLIYPLLSLFSIAIDYLRTLDPDFVYPENLEELIENESEFIFTTMEKIIQRKNKDFYFSRDMESMDVNNKEQQLEEALELLPNELSFYASGASFCLDVFNKNPKLVNLLEEYNIFRTMYYLASSLFAEGFSESAMEIWGIVYNNPASNLWGEKSYEQIQNPHVEIGLTIF